MNFLRKTLTALAIGASLLGTACVDDPGSEIANVTDISENLMPKSPKAPGEFSINRNDAGEWTFTVIGAKGETLLTSEAYTTKVAALNGILSVEDNGVHLDKYETSTTPEGEITFVLRAANGQVIADGGLFHGQEEADAAVATARDMVAGIVQYKAAITKGAKFDLFKHTDKKWYFSLKAADGKVLIESQSYKARTGALTGLESVRLNGKDPSNYAVASDAGKFYFTLDAANGQEIGQSADSFASEAEAEAAITATSELLKSERVASPW